jgi:hypothetical protein
MMLKTGHKANAKFANVPDNAGASAIFKLFHSRPALLENRLMRPPTATTALNAIAVAVAVSSPDASSNESCENC